MTTKTELPPGYRLAEDLEKDDVIDIGNNHYVIIEKTTNAFKEITLWLELISLHALYETPPSQLKATLNFDPKIIVKIYE